MDLAIMIEGQDGLTWERWIRLAAATEDLGFAGLYRSDHYTNARPPEKDSLELWVSLAYLATHTKRIEFGPLVSPVSFRHPSITARMAAGCNWAWVRAGMNANTSCSGLKLLDPKPRMDRFEEGLEVVTRLLKSDKPFSYSGEYYELKDAILLPRPARPGGPPIIVGGNGKGRTLDLAAKYSKEWNGTGQTPKGFHERCQILDEKLTRNGRNPADVRRTLMTSVTLGRDTDHLQQLTKISGRSKEELRSGGRFIGEANEIVDQLGEMAEAGCQRVMLQWLEQDDLDGLEYLAKTVLPHFQH